MDDLRKIFTVLETLQREVKITSAEYDYLSASITKAIRYNLDNTEKLRELDMECFNQIISLEENIERRRELLCYEAPIKVKTSAKVIDNLIKDNVFGENKKGIHFLEPYYQFARNIAMKRISSLLSESNDLLRNMHKLFLKKLHIYTPFSDRTSVAGMIGDLVDDEDCVIFSGTPSIFNPFEPKDTDWFKRSMLKTSREVFYIWNRDSIAKQINDQLSIGEFNSNQLQERYFHYFKQFVQGKLVVIYGNNYSINKDWETLPVISKTKRINGVRDNGGKLCQGTLVNYSKIYFSLKPIPQVGGYVEGVNKLKESSERKDVLVNDYIKYRRTARDSADTIKLLFHDEDSVKKFVEAIFVDATRRTS